MRNTLFIDFGGVIVDEGPEWGTEKYLDRPAIKDSFFYISKLINEIFGAESTFIISKVKSNSGMTKTLDWLDKKSFFTETGFNPYHIRFCGSRMEKFFIAKELGICYGIDNRCEIFSLLDNYNCYFERGFVLNPREDDYIRYKGTFSDRIRRVATWEEIYKSLNTIS